MNKKFGDRRDGKKIKMNGFDRFLYYLKPRRSDSEVYISKTIDVTNLVEYMKEKKKENEKITYFHLFCMAIGKVIYNRPLLNRFIVNKKYYDRNDVLIAFTAKVNYEDTSKEILKVIKIDPEDNLFSIKEKTLKAVSDVRNAKEEGTNSIMNIIGKLPSFLISLVVKVVKYMDRHDLLPKSLINDNLYYSTCIVSNLGSIKSSAIYHNLTDFGTSSILATFGEIREENGRKYAEAGINIDERIADGVYFVKSVKLMQDILNNPKCLEGNVNDKIKETTKFKY